MRKPVPYLDEMPLQRSWRKNATKLSVGSSLDVDGRCYRVLGFDPVSVRPRRVYLMDLETGREHLLLIREEED